MCCPQYAHLGTGNYNATTARIYTDLSLLTADPEITGAVHDVFSFLTAYAENPTTDLCWWPLDLAERCMSLIERERRMRGWASRAHHCKVNSLLDKDIVRALYSASQAGVEIDLLVRGICSLRRESRHQRPHPVRSIVDGSWNTAASFTSRTRRAEVYLGSADWMPRNLHERVEVLFRSRAHCCAIVSCMRFWPHCSPTT